MDVLFFLFAACFFLTQIKFKVVFFRIFGIGTKTKLEIGNEVMDLELILDYGRRCGLASYV